MFTLISKGKKSKPTPNKRGCMTMRDSFWYSLSKCPCLPSPLSFSSTTTEGNENRNKYFLDENDDDTYRETSIRRRITAEKNEDEDDDYDEEVQIVDLVLKRKVKTHIENDIEFIEISEDVVELNSDLLR